MLCNKISQKLFARSFKQYQMYKYLGVLLIQISYGQPVMYVASQNVQDSTQSRRCVTFQLPQFVLSLLVIVFYAHVVITIYKSYQSCVYYAGVKIHLHKQVEINSTCSFEPWKNIRNGMKPIGCSAKCITVKCQKLNIRKVSIFQSLVL